MNLYPEVEVETLVDGSVILKSPWMHSRITGWTTVVSQMETWSQIADFPAISTLPYWQFAPLTSAHRPRSLAPSEKIGLLDDLTAILTPIHDNLGQTYDWPIREILKESQCPDCPDVFDPLACFSILRRYTLLGMTQSSRLGRWFYTASQNKGPLSDQDLKILTGLVHISRLVTSKAPKILEKACAFPGQSGELMKKFIATEMGHEIFAIRSLRFLSENQGNCAIFHPSRAFEFFFNILDFAAQNSPLGTATILFSLEGLAYSEMPASPWSLLEQLDHRHKTGGVGYHSYINHRDGHAYFGQELADSLPWQSFEDICLAARIAELSAKLQRLLLDLVIEEAL